MPIRRRMPEPASNRRTRRSEATRRKLLDVALRLFAERPAHAVAIEELTEAADVGKGTFYNYFTSRELLLDALMAECFELLLSEVRSRVPERAGPKGVERALDALLDAHVDFFQREPDRFIIYLSGVLTSLREMPSERLDRRILQYLHEIDLILRPFLPGEIGTDRLRSAGCAIAGFTYGYVSMASIGLESSVLQQAQRPLRRTLVRSLRDFLCESPSTVASEA